MDPNSYLTFTFGIQSQNNADKSISIGYADNNEDADVYRYNYDIMAWEKMNRDTSTAGRFNFLTDYRSSQIASFTTYLVGRNYTIADPGLTAEIKSSLPPNPPNVPVPSMNGFPAMGPALYNNGLTDQDDDIVFEDGTIGSDYASIKQSVYSYNAGSL
jgi:hypothetical protein